MPFLRRLAERLTHRLVFKRRLPAAFGHVPLYVSTEGGLRYFRRLASVDPLLLDLAAELVTPGAVVWDAGANVGLFTFAAAALAGPTGRVVAIEPDTLLVDLLRRSSQLEPARRAPVEVFPVALSDRVDLLHFNVAKRARSASHLDGCIATQTGGTRERQKVMSVTLDWLLERCPPPRVVKIDVEGAEARVLSGAARLLSEIRPLVLCEVFSENAAAITQTLRSAGYSLFDAAIERPARRPLERAAFNTLAIAAATSG